MQKQWVRFLSDLQIAYVKMTKTKLYQNAFIYYICNNKNIMNLLACRALWHTYRRTILSFIYDTYQTCVLFLRTEGHFLVDGIDVEKLSDDEVRDLLGAEDVKFTGQLG